MPLTTCTLWWAGGELITNRVNTEPPQLSDGTLGPCCFFPVRLTLAPRQVEEGSVRQSLKGGMNAACDQTLLCRQIPGPLRPPG